MNNYYFSTSTTPTVREFLNSAVPIPNVYIPEVKFTLDCLKPRKVIVNNPATIIIWEDGTKTVVKCGKNDTFDAEKGIAMCIVKRIMFFNKTTQMNKWFTKQVEEFDDHE